VLVLLLGAVPVREGVLGMSDATAEYGRNIAEARRELAPLASLVALDGKRQAVVPFGPADDGWFFEAADETLVVELTEEGDRTRSVLERIKSFALDKGTGEPARIWSGGRVVQPAHSFLRVWVWKELRDTAAYAP
jgi:hypothetical protein